MTSAHIFWHTQWAGQGFLLWLGSLINPATPDLPFREDGSVSKSLSWPPSCFSMKQAAVTHGQWTGEPGFVVLLRKTYKANLRNLHPLQNNKTNKPKSILKGTQDRKTVVSTEQNKEQNHTHIMSPHIEGRVSYETGVIGQS